MKNDRDDDEERRPTIERGAEWHFRHEEPLSRNERREYVRWLKRSPDNVAAALAIDHLSHVLREVGWLQQTSVQADAASKVIELYPQERRPSRARVSEAPSSWQVAAAVTIVVAGSLTLAVKVTRHDQQVIMTEDREWHVQVLDDGSRVKIGPLSRISVEFTGRQRSVLLTSGDALFEVTKDANRPFIVATDIGTARAVGTKFGVTHHDATMTVTVAEGLVEVARVGPAAGRSAASRARSVTLSAGQQVEVSSMGLFPVRRVDADDELAWVQGQFIFNDRTIAEAAMEFNRRNPVQIQVSDAVIADRPVRGVFEIADPRSFTKFLAGTEQVRVVEIGQDVLRLEPMASPDSPARARPQAGAQ